MIRARLGTSRCHGVNSNHELGSFGGELQKIEVLGVGCVENRCETKAGDPETAQTPLRGGQKARRLRVNASSVQSTHWFVRPPNPPKGASNP